MIFSSRLQKHYDMLNITIVYVFSQPKADIMILQKTINNILTYKNSISEYEVNIIIVNQSLQKNIAKSNDICFGSINYTEIKKNDIVCLAAARNEAIQYLNDDGYTLFADEDIIIDSSIYNVKDYTNFDIIVHPVHDTKSGKIFNENIMHENKLDFSVIIQYVMSASVIYSNRVLKKYRFDERFGVGAKYGSGEETEILIRAKSDNMSIKYSQNIICSTEIADWQYISHTKIYNYAIGVGAILAYHRTRIRMYVTVKILFRPILTMLKNIITVNPKIVGRSITRLSGIIAGYILYRLKEENK